MIRPSPLPNRCHPDGTLVAVSARGTMMGNRGGRLHRNDFTLGRARWRGPAWICCETSFRNRHRTVMGQGYTELFFLDEATALAAGHRPCFACRNAEARRFATCWTEAHATSTPVRAGEIDRVLHAARRGPPYEIDAGKLPPGAICRQEGRFWLRTRSGWLEWTDLGYLAGRGPAPDRTTRLCTPEPTCAVLRAGYAPRLHPSATAPGKR